MITRIVNINDDDHDVYVGRGSIYGNPFTHLPLNKTQALISCLSRIEAIKKYELWIWGTLWISSHHPPTVDKIKELRGKRLGCHCYPKACHGSVLARIAEMTDEQTNEVLAIVPVKESFEESTEDLWDLYLKGYPACITTNCVRKSDGMAVMGAGIALQAARRYPDIAVNLGNILEINGDHPAFAHIGHDLYSFPTKIDWRKESDVDLIVQSAKEMMEFVRSNKINRIVLPRPGCANGKLYWSDMSKALKNILDGRVIIVGR